jgi:cellulase/cellobiase CelA1
VIVSALALTVSLLQLGDSGGKTTAGADSSSLPVAEPGLPSPSLGSSPGRGRAGASSTSRASGTDSATRSGDPDTEPQGTSTSPVDDPSTASDRGKGGPSTCRVRYEVVNEWPDGFQATVTVTSTRALDDWSIGWSFGDGQRITQMWDGTYTQNGSRVTAKAADYNKKVTANGTFSVGFLSSWHGSNSQPHDFTVNGAGCSTAG